jgi:hypothetical protein
MGCAHAAYLAGAALISRGEGDHDGRCALRHRLRWLGFTTSARDVDTGTIRVDYRFGGPVVTSY